MLKILIFAITLLQFAAAPVPMTNGTRVDIQCGRHTAASASGAYEGQAFSVSCTAGGFGSQTVYPVSGATYNFTVTQGATSCPFSGTNGQAWFTCAQTTITFTNVNVFP